MKRTGIISLLTVLVLCLAAVSAARAAAENAWRTKKDFWDRAVRADFRSLGLGKKTTLPVYAAPGEDAYRAAKGKASVSLSEPVLFLGETADGSWQMIEYDISKGARRVGWIRLPREAAKPKPPDFFADAVLGRMTAETKATDDPRGSGRALCSLPAGQKVAVIFETAAGGKPFLYVKTEIDGKTAAGFIPGGLCEPLPMYRIEGDTIVVADGVEQLGSVVGWWDYGEDGLSAPVWRGEEPARVFGRISLSLDSDEGGDLESDVYPLMETTKLVLPDTIRGIGSGALFGIRTDELDIPEGVTHLDDGDAIYAASVGTLRIPASLTNLDMNAAFTYTPVSCFEVSEGNPAYCSKDGVLFSRDGKTLAAYPSGRQDTHYDVPAGTEVIGANAFRDDRGALPLVTISLPVGLREIGPYAFAECGNLVSLAVPPTVKSVAENAFAYCVSLQRLSLPQGFTAVFDEYWVSRDDDSAFNGDNGATLAFPEERDEEPDDWE